MPIGLIALALGGFGIGLTEFVIMGLLPEVVAPSSKAGAIALMFTGLTAANVLGVPFGTLLGQAAGWRATFWAITAIGVVALAGILALVPRTAGGKAEAGGLRRELR